MAKAVQSAQKAQKKLPDFNVYVVTKKDSSDKGFWTKVGAAWSHEDGGGLSVTLLALPADGQLVLRAPKPDDGE